MSAEIRITKNVQAQLVDGSVWLHSAGDPTTPALIGSADEAAALGRWLLDVAAIWPRLR